MNDKDFETTKERIQQHINKWLPILGLKWWDVDVTYTEDPCSHYADAYACTSVAWEYGDAWITFHMRELPEKTDEQLEKIVVHECCHILVSEMRDYAEGRESEGGGKHEERVVTQLTKAFLWVYEHAFNTGQLLLTRRPSSWTIQESAGERLSAPIVLTVEDSSPLCELCHTFVGIFELRSTDDFSKLCKQCYEKEVGKTS